MSDNLEVLDLEGKFRAYIDDLYFEPDGCLQDHQLRECGLLPDDPKDRYYRYSGSLLASGHYQGRAINTSRIIIRKARVHRSGRTWETMYVGQVAIINADRIFEDTLLLIGKHSFHVNGMEKGVINYILRNLKLHSKLIISRDGVKKENSRVSIDPDWDENWDTYCPNDSYAKRILDQSSSLYKHLVDNYYLDFVLYKGNSVYFAEDLYLLLDEEDPELIEQVCDSNLEVFFKECVEAVTAF